MGSKAYGKATELLITADAGGSNAYRSRVFKTELQAFADRTGLTIGVSHFPPGTSKWNKIEHRMFCHITENWRGRPLIDRETVVQLVGATRTATGLRVRAKLDDRTFPKGVEVTDEQLAEVNMIRDTFHGEWNYTIVPRQKIEVVIKLFPIGSKGIRLFGSRVRGTWEKWVSDARRRKRVARREN